jgi:glycosyltransferase involved in cell wall biosynthesis
MERLSLKGHVIRVVDFEISWRMKQRKGLYSKRRVFGNVSKVCEGSIVTVVRPGMFKFPLLDYVSIVFAHALEIRREIEQFKPDVIVGLGILNAFVGSLMAQRHGMPFLYYLIDTLHTLIPFESLKPLGKVLEGSTLRRCDIVCVINEELACYAVSMGAQPRKIHVVRAGIDVKRFNPSVDGRAIRKKLGIHEDDFVLFFMGWLYQFSGLKEVAAELAMVKDEYPDLKLLIVGEGELLHELHRIKKGYELDQLVLVGWQPYEKIPEFIAASDICLLPAYDNEVMRHIVPIKMYEYMACGKPVLASRLPGIMKEFGEGNGVVYVDKSEEALKKAIMLRDDDEALKKLGSRARSFVEKYSWDKITDSFEVILDGNIGRVRQERSA